MQFDPIQGQDIDRLAPLWLGLHAHHQKIAPQLAPFVPDEVSWANRRCQYMDIISGAWFGLVARDGERDIGYVLGARRPMIWNATFARPASLWELVTLFVVEEWRGRGAGARMLSAMDEFVARQDVRARLVGVIPTNPPAVLLYRTLGYVPAWLTLTRFQRPTPVRGSAPPVEIRALGKADLDALESLWLSLHHHHQAVSPYLAPFVTDAASWPIIEALLAKSAEAGLVLAAVEAGRIVGFVSAGIYSCSELLSYADTWVTDARVAEIKFLVIDKNKRGKGIGRVLTDAIDQVLADKGVRDQFVGAIAPNEGAIRFYEARGFRPAWLELMKS
jgi:GNAT superfamily N-acetyltransferase